MRPYAGLACLGVMLFSMIAFAADERAEETVSLARLKAEEVKCRIANDRFVLDFKRQWHASDAKLGKKSLITLTGDEPGRFSGVHLNKGRLVEPESGGILSKKEEGDSYADKVVIEIDWVDVKGEKAKPEEAKSETPKAGLVKPDRPRAEDVTAAHECEAEALRAALVALGFPETSLPSSDREGMKKTLKNGLDLSTSANLVKMMADGGFWSADEAEGWKNMVADLKKIPEQLAQMADDLASKNYSVKGDAGNEKLKKDLDNPMSRKKAADQLWQLEKKWREEVKEDEARISREEERARMEALRAKKKPQKIPRTKFPHADPQILLARLERVEKDLLAAGKQYMEKYWDFAQKQALLNNKDLKLKYTFLPDKISLPALEKLVTVILRIPMIKEQLPSTPGSGQDDHAKNALAFYTAKATDLFNYVAGNPVPEEALSDVDRNKADVALAFSIEATFTPAESAVPSAPCRAGLLGEALKEIEINGHTDPKQGSGLQWWLLQTAHPQNFDISAAPEMASSYAFHWVQREKNATEIWVRVRAIGDAAGDYTIKCSDTALTKGDAIRVFANDQPLRGEFPY